MHNAPPPPAKLKTKEDFKRITFFVSRAEFELFKKLAYANGMSCSQYLRSRTVPVARKEFAKIRKEGSE